MIGIGAAVAHRPLPHHRAYGSVHSGSIGYANTLRLTTETGAACLQAQTADGRVSCQLTNPGLMGSRV